MMVSQVGLFSSNESIDEMPTSSIKFLLLPARLGCLTLQRQYVRTASPENCSNSNKQENGSSSNGSPGQTPDRATVLKLAKIYFRDFITRCKQYEITSIELPNDDRSTATSNTMTVRGARPTPEVTSVHKTLLP